MEVAYDKDENHVDLEALELGTAEWDKLCRGKCGLVRSAGSVSYRVYGIGLLVCALSMLWRSSLLVKV